MLPGLGELTPTTVALMDPMRGTGSGQMDRSGDINHGDQDNQVIQIAEMIILHSTLVYGMTLVTTKNYLSCANMTQLQHTMMKGEMFTFYLIL